LIRKVRTTLKIREPPVVKNIVWASVIILFAAILESTILPRLAIYEARPDLALVILVFVAYVNGTMTGQLTGFCSGLLIDFLSAAPLGFNTFIRTIIGAAAGTMKGTFFLDPVTLPMILCIAATLAKALLIFILHLLFAGAVPSYSFISLQLWVEVLLNAFFAPFIFGLLKLFKPILIAGRDA
jgi:rod shape-determining protein MreD